MHQGCRRNQGARHCHLLRALPWRIREVMKVVVVVVVVGMGRNVPNGPLGQEVLHPLRHVAPLVLLVVQLI